MRSQHLLVGVIDFCRRNARAVVLASVVLAVFAGFYAGGHLDLSSETDRLFAANLSWRQRAAALKTDFPQFQNLLVAVIDAREPEEAEATATALTEILAADQAHFQSVRRPDGSPFFRKEGMLFLDSGELEAALDRIIDAQPFLGELARDPSAEGLFAALALLARGAEQHADLGPYRTALAAFHDAMADTIAGRPHPLSWIRLLAGKLADGAGPYKFVLAQPRLDHTRLEPGGTALREMREVASELEFVKSGDARVRVTGSVALADEEFATVAQGAVEGMVASILLITLWLFLAVRSWRLIVSILLTLALGLALTLLFAAIAVGTLNLISVGFGILFVGIAVDFAIQFCVRYREMLSLSSDTAIALRETGRRAGGPILIAAAATAAGFLSFVPTDFRGVAELGLIAGVGMLIAFLCTMTFLPAMVTLCRPPHDGAEVGFGWGARLDASVRRHRRLFLALFAGLGGLGLALLPRLTFDANPLHTKDPTTEAMRTLDDLRESPLANPFTVDIMTSGPAAAAALSERLRDLPLVAGVLSINRFVPADQPAKLALIADAGEVLRSTLAPHPPAVQPEPAEIRTAARRALGKIEPVLSEPPPEASIAALADDLRRLAVAPDAVLREVDRMLTRFLPAQLDRLRDALRAQPVTLQTLPPELARDWLLPDGRARIQVLPKPEARNSRGLAEFVAEVAGVAPDASGSAPTVVATSATIVASFRSAAIAALVAITMILFLALRRLLDIALVLAPLLLSALMTVTVLALLPLPLNYANIIVLPLLLGVGVSFNIYFVMNWRAGQSAVLGSATARAILFSALTTGSAFGSLAMSRHPGTASMGWLLLISLGFTLLSSLVFLPALLAAFPHAGPTGAAARPIAPASAADGGVTDINCGH
jgi:hopanoid biosynthesis associated RND transporter like protein HpnN